MRKVTAILLTSFSASVLPIQADEYNLFSSFQYSELSIEGLDIDGTSSLASQYYFDSLEALGPRDQFDYIIKSNSITANYFNGDGVDGYLLGGNMFLGNFHIGAHYFSNDVERVGNLNDVSLTGNRLTLGYLFSDNFIFNINRIESEKIIYHSAFDSYLKLDDEDYSLELKYNHEINGTDYFGTSIEFFEDNDLISLNNKYFTKLNEENYLVLRSNITFNQVYAAFDGEEEEIDYHLDLDYYFSKNTAVGFGVSKNDRFRLGTKHFISNNFAIFAKGEVDNDSNKEWTVGFEYNL